MWSNLQTLLQKVEWTALYTTVEKPNERINQNIDIWILQRVDFF